MFWETAGGMNSNGGVNDADRVSVIPGSHGHYNWGFSAPGSYQIAFEAAGVHRADGPQNSGPVTYQFQVVPEPLKPGRSSGSGWRHCAAWDGIGSRRETVLREGFRLGIGDSEPFTKCAPMKRPTQIPNLSRRGRGFPLRISDPLELGALVKPRPPNPRGFPLSHQHADLRIRYAPGTTNELFLMVHDGDAGTTMRPPMWCWWRAAVRDCPSGWIPAELGEPGSLFWILPASQDPELLYLRCRAKGLPGGTFESPLRVRMTGMRAMGDFKAWQFESDGSF